MELITEDKAFEPSEEHGEKIIRFDTVVSVVVGDSHPGRRIVGFRKMSAASSLLLLRFHGAAGFGRMLILLLFAGLCPCHFLVLPARRIWTTVSRELV